MIALGLGFTALQEETSQAARNHPVESDNVQRIDANSGLCKNVCIQSPIIPKITNKLKAGGSTENKRRINNKWKTENSTQNRHQTHQT